MAERDDPLAGGRGKPSASDTGTAAGLDALATRLSEVARALQDESTPADTLAAVVQASIDLVPGADEGSISVVMGRRDVTSAAASSSLPERVDALQAETGQGPCLDAVYEQQTVRVPEMSIETRWPHFAQRAFEAGALGMLSFQLYVEGDNLGALNLYSRRANAFSDESEHVGLLLAAHAAIAYAGARTEEQLGRAIDHRDLIGQAKGILMERFDIDAQAAFAILVKFSQESDIKLFEMATRLTQRR
ncbi:MAG TPA: GAF and ANTAR domain-containing protein [Mycobacteriales bacterium]|jgi:GAF domain-containing protein|nr:GAF and ANTAR domain-containing protein [Mycobacteriales bacterium]